MWFKSQFYTLYHKDTKKFQPYTYNNFVTIALQILGAVVLTSPQKI